MRLALLPIVLLCLAGANEGCAAAAGDDGPRADDLEASDHGRTVVACLERERRAENDSPSNNDLNVAHLMSDACMRGANNRTISAIDARRKVGAESARAQFEGFRKAAYDVCGAYRTIPPDYAVRVQCARDAEYGLARALETYAGLTTEPEASLTFGSWGELHRKCFELNTRADASLLKCIEDGVGAYLQTQNSDLEPLVRGLRTNEALCASLLERGDLPINESLLFRCRVDAALYMQAMAPN